MGGPSSLDEVNIFLSNMFRDKNIITVKSDLLRSFVGGMIVKSRGGKARKNYEQLGGKSPIVGHTKKLIKKLNRKYRFEYVMRYTPPFAEDVLKKLKDDGIEKLILFPLYPQYSTTTTLSSFEDIFENLKKLIWTDVSVCTVKPYYDDQKFITLITDSILSTLQEKKRFDSTKVDLIFSAHSLPQKIVDAGDPYQEQTEKQVELISRELRSRGVEFKSISLAYQSKLGPMKWLEPSLETRLGELKGAESVVIYPISFTIDNSETDLELDIEYREVAEKLDIGSYKVIKVLNDSEEFVQYIFNKLVELQ
jgi:ferrochelatase